MTKFIPAVLVEIIEPTSDKQICVTLRDGSVFFCSAFEVSIYDQQVDGFLAEDYEEVE